MLGCACADSRDCRAGHKRSLFKLLPQPGEPQPPQQGPGCPSASFVPGELQGVSQGLPALHLHSLSWLCLSVLCRRLPSSQTSTQSPSSVWEPPELPWTPHSWGTWQQKLSWERGWLQGTESGKDSSPPARGMGPAGSGTSFVGLVPLQPLKVAVDRARPVPVLGLVWEGRPGLTPDLTPSCHQPLLRAAKVALKMGWKLGKPLCRG